MARDTRWRQSRRRSHERGPLRNEDLEGRQMALAEVSRSLMPKFGAAEKESRLRSRQPMASSDAVEEVLGESKRVAKNDKEGKIVRIAMKRPEHCGFRAWFTDAVLHLGPNEQRRMEWGHLAPFTLGAFTKLFCRCHFEIVLLRKMLDADALQISTYTVMQPVCIL